MSTQDSQRQQLRNIVTRNGKSGRIPEILESELDELEAYVTTRVKEAEEQAQIKGEIIGKKAAYRKAIMGAGEYHDDPYSYVVPIEHLRQYEAELSQFDLSEPIFRDKTLTTTTNGKEQ